MSRAGFSTLAAKCRGKDGAALDDLIAYATLDLCDPSGLNLLLTAAYSHLPLERAESAIDRLAQSGLVSRGVVAGHATDLYITN